MFKSKSKPGMAMTEVAIGITLAVVAVFVAIGLFNDNLSGMAISSNLSNFFKGNDTKTYFTSFNRDYSDSQINVQIMGEQGLQMLRRKANNLAIDQINSAFHTSNPDVSAINANSIGYLALAIKAIVGSPDICVYMKKDSDKFCNEDKIGGYNYKINSGSSTLTINKVDTVGNSLGETRVLTVGNEASGIFSNAVVDTTNGRSTLNEDEKYKFINDLSTKAEPYVYRHVILIRSTDTFTSAKNAMDSASALTNILSSLKTSLQKAHNDCTTKVFGVDFNIAIPEPFTPSGCTRPLEHGTKKGSNIGFVNNDELDEFDSWAQVVSGNINASDNKDAAEMINKFLQNENINRMIEIFQNDHRNNPTSCDVFKNGLKDIIDKNNLTITVPECNPNDMDL